MATPSEDELIAAVTTVRDAHADLGILRLWAQLKVEQPGWAVSEKRFRKALAAVGGTASGAGSTAAEGGSSSKKSKSKTKKNITADGPELVAKTGLDPSVDVQHIAPKVQAHMFGGTRGKGLVAKSGIEAGEWLWEETPWMACSDPTLKPHLVSKALCTHCLTPLDPRNMSQSVECGSCTAAHFCNRLCASRARPTASHHDLLCEGVNPAARGINEMVAGREWRSFDIVARMVARWRGERAWGSPEAAAEVERRVWGGIARVNMATRESEKADWASRKDFTERQWKLAHEALVAALNPSDPFAAKRFDKILASKAPRTRRMLPLTDAEVQRWFSYDSFLEMLGMVNINLHDVGGLYALHAHMNHSCDPNVQVRTLPRSFTPPTSLPAELPGRGDPSDPPSHKITVIAREPITPGTELTITYVDPSLPRNVRRQALRDGYGFWCECARCEREKRAEEEERAAREAENARIEKAAQEAFEKAKAAAEGAGSKAGVDEVAAKIAEL